METLLLRLIQLSSKLIERIDSCKLEDIEVYMQERDIVFAELQQLIPAPDQVAAFRFEISRITEMDTIITGRMTVLRNEANHEIDKINRGKRSKSMYESASYVDDSLFFDTKR
ncbi:hypothetical protein [Paenibacillus prosopidis]|uniref:Flagellar protein FliT n=1 Tax=Paenibacillus prosopidis TaxID=630520 RepID=A0A368VUK8_9BACL|nr:hypothetical protein [Paenibacillus prosopidis]RCW44808.1 hypothetical protein DFP97_11133 [Paenibacillus prosopidis]